MPKGVKYGSCEAYDRKRALEEVRNGDIRLIVASRKYSVARAAL
jgi:hypothetical protein